MIKIMNNEINTKVLAKVLEKILDSKDDIQSITLDDEEKSVSFTFTASAFEAIRRLKHTLTETIKKEQEQESIKVQIDNFSKNASIEEKVKVILKNQKNINAAPRAKLFLKGENPEVENVEKKAKNKKTTKK